MRIAHLEGRPAAVNVGSHTGPHRKERIPMKLAPTLIACLFIAAPASAAPHTQTAVLAGGCFWGMEAVFEHVKGVTDVVSGYAGGGARDASYDAVSSERTG